MKVYRMLAKCPNCKTEKEVEVEWGKDPRCVKVMCSYCGRERTQTFDGWSFKKPEEKP